MYWKFNMRFLLFSCICLLFSLPYRSVAQVLLDGETGMVFSGYNDIRIPGDKGTLFSFSDDISPEPALYYRIRAGYTFDGGHTVSLLVAPLKLTANGIIHSPLRFQDEVFASGTELQGTYVFNSYRLSYRYDVIESEAMTLGVGLTAKIRDAYIQVEGAGRSSRKSNVGFVPLINFYFDWRPLERWGIMVEGDALAAPQGRAEDVFFGVYFYDDRFLRIKAGYRLLEGGADNDEVYNFTLQHYAALGAVVRF